MDKITYTPMLKRYIFKFAVRIAIFLAILTLYLFGKERLWAFAIQPVSLGITPLHVLWFVFMIMMIRHLIPRDSRTMALLKAEEKEYIEQQGYSELELYRFVKTQNVRAWQVMLLWLSVNAVFGPLYLFHVLDEADLIMLSVFYFLCDYICILIFCPFQSWIMKNHCCINCRIFDWGHFMMFTPMLFIRNFFSWSLFFTALVVLIRWELVYAEHPERFWNGSNRTIQCANCQDKTCQIKRKAADKLFEKKQKGERF